MVEIRTMVCIAFAALAAAFPATAGSPIGDLEYRFPCQTGWGQAELRFSERFDAAVGVDPGDGGAVLWVNERFAFEMPYEVVAFEYFSACEQLHMLTRGREAFGAQDFLRDADCIALDLLEKEGLVRGHEGFAAIFDAFRYWRAQDQYLGISFAERADLIQRFCPR